MYGLEHSSIQEPAILRICINVGASYPCHPVVIFNTVEGRGRSVFLGPDFTRIGVDQRLAHKEAFMRVDVAKMKCVWYVWLSIHLTFCTNIGIRIE